MFKMNRIALAREGVNYKDVVGVTVFGTGAEIDLKVVQMKDGTSVKIVPPLWFNSEVAPVRSWCTLALSGWAMQYDVEVLK